VKAGATIAVERYGDRDVVVDQRSAAPFSVRQSGGRILLAASAAAPVGGDELELTIDVGPGARAVVGSVAASMVWPGPDGAPSSTTTTCTVGSGGHLDLWLEPTISVAGSHHRAKTLVRLAEGATCRVVEEVVLGRTGEPSGRLDVTLRVERAGLPLLYHAEAFGPGVPGALSSVSIGTARFALAGFVVGTFDVDSPLVHTEGSSAAAWLPVSPSVDNEARPGSGTGTGVGTDTGTGTDNGTVADRGKTGAAVALAVGPDRPTTLNLLGGLTTALV
jgi:urease accessory protein